MRCKLGLLAAILLFAGQATAQLELTTSNNTNLSHSIGMFFDLAASADQTIKGFDVYLNPGLRTIQVWRVTDGSGWLANAGNSDNWTLLGESTVYATNASVATRIPLALDVPLPSGSTMGFHLAQTSSINGSGVRYEQGSNLGGVDVSTSGLSILEGSGGGLGGVYLTAPGSTSRKFRGAVRFAAGLVGAGLTESTAAVPDGFQSGVTFDVEAKENDIIVNGLSVGFFAAPYELKLYVAESNASFAVTPFVESSWRLIGQRSGFFYFGSGVVKLPFDFEVVVPKGTRRGFYLASSDPFAMLMQDTSSGPVVKDGADLRIHSGVAYDAASSTFGAQVGSGLFEGSVHYQIPNQMTGITAGGSSVMSVNPPAVNTGDDGVWFDLKSNEPIVVNALDYFLIPGSYTIEVWARTGGGSFAGSFTNSALWTKISSEAITSSGSKVQVAQDLRLFIPAGGVQGIYISSTLNNVDAVFGYQDTGVLGDLQTDGTLTITTGVLGDYPFNPQQYGVQPIVDISYRKLGRADNGFFEDFSSAAGILPPTGWLSSLVEGNRPKLDGWRFDNPGNRNINLPQSGPIAIFDTDESGTSNFVTGSLYSPAFDASGDTQVTLAFDGYFRQFQFNSQAWLEVWDGSVWNELKSYSSTQASNPTAEIYDITAAAGGSTDAMLRFRYEGNYAWYWQIDNVNLQIGQKGQRPQLDIGEFDINYSRDARHNQPVASGLPGPYVATAHVLSPTIFHWEGEPNQPIQLLAGYLNLGNVILDPQGQLDIGSYDVITNTFPGLLLVADGTAADLFNAAFRTSNAGECTIASYLPPFVAGQTINFQSVVYSSTQNIALTNVVTMTVLP